MHLSEGWNRAELRECEATLKRERAESIQLPWGVKERTGASEEGNFAPLAQSLESWVKEGYYWEVQFVMIYAQWGL